VEVGAGQILTPVEETRGNDGHWQGQWSGGNHLLEPSSLHHVTHCACYYAKGDGAGRYWYLSNYGVASIKESAHLPIESVCKPYFDKLGGCPRSNASAFAKWGPPWIEAYEGCVPEPESVLTLFM